MKDRVAMTERLTNIGAKGEIWITDNDETRKIGKKEAAYAKLKEYEDAEEQGLLLRLPCKVGDAVYVVVGKDISKQKVQRVTIDSEGKIEFCTRKRGFALFDFEKTVFLAREEAEAKLAEMSCFQNGNS